jgi:hypothetical protein
LAFKKKKKIFFFFFFFFFFFLERKNVFKDLFIIEKAKNININRAQDANVMVWQIPEEGIAKQINEPVQVCTIDLKLSNVINQKNRLQF